GEFCVGGRFVNRNDAADFERLNVLCAFQIKLAFTACVIQKFELRLGDLQAATLPSFFDLAIKRDELAGLEAVAQVFAVEPDALEGGAPLPGHQFKDGHSVARAKYGGVADLSNHGGHFTGAQLGDAARV